MACISPTCALVTQQDYFYFLWTLTNVVGSADQMNNPPTWILNTTCNYLTASGDVVENFAKAFMFNNGMPTGAGSCVSFSEEAMIKATQNTTAGVGGASTCPPSIPCGGGCVFSHMLVVVFVFVSPLPLRPRVVVPEVHRVWLLQGLLQRHQHLL